jgi:hypothetical protein
MEIHIIMAPTIGTVLCILTILFNDMLRQALKGIDPLKRDQALNDVTNGPLGEQPKPKSLGRGEFPAPETDKNIETELLARCLEICDANNTKTNE